MKWLLYLLVGTAAMGAALTSPPPIAVRADTNGFLAVPTNFFLANSNAVAAAVNAVGVSSTATNAINSVNATNIYGAGLQSMTNAAIGVSGSNAWVTQYGSANLTNWSGWTTNEVSLFWSNAAANAVLGSSNNFKLKTNHVDGVPADGTVVTIADGSVVWNAPTDYTYITNNGLYAFSGWSTNDVSLWWSNTVDYASNIVWLKAHNATNNNLYSWSGLTTNAVSLQMSNTVDYASNVVWVAANNATNNSVFARTNMVNWFSKSNYFTDPVTITTTGSIYMLDFPTNLVVPTAPPIGIIRTYSYDDNGFVQLENITDLGIRKRLNRDITWVLRNVQGAPITKGQAVYIFSGTGTRSNVKLARADSDTTMPVVAVATATVADSAFGEFMVVGKMVDLKTDYATWAEGDVLYVSDTVAGALTNVAPAHPSFKQEIGIIHFASPTVGIIGINTKSQLGEEDGTSSLSYKIGTGTNMVSQNGSKINGVGFTNNSVSVGWSGAFYGSGAGITNALSTNNSLYGWSGISTNTSSAQWSNTVNYASNIVWLKAYNTTNNNLYSWSGITTNAVSLQMSNTVDYASNVVWLKAYNTTNNNLYSWSGITTNAVSLQMSNTVDYASNVVWLKANGVTNNGLYGFSGWSTNGLSVFYTNAALGAAANATNNGLYGLAGWADTNSILTTNLAQTLWNKTIVYSTNAALNGDTVDLDRTVQYTNAAGAITFAGITGTDVNKFKQCTMLINANGSDRLVTFPTSWENPDDAVSFTVTNGWKALMTLGVYGNMQTSVVWRLIK